MVGAVLGLLVVSTSLVALAQPGGSQIVGTVQAVDGNTVRLADGGGFVMGEPVGVTLLLEVAAADITPDMYIAITAARGVDGSLIASTIRVFPENANRAGASQRDMTDTAFCEPLCQPGDLMTNAVVQDAVVNAVAGSELTVTFQDSTERVLITPTTRFYTPRAGSLADVTAGASVVGFVNPASEVATTVWVYLN